VGSLGTAAIKCPPWTRPTLFLLLLLSAGEIRPARPARTGALWQQRRAHTGGARRRLAQGRAFALRASSTRAEPPAPPCACARPSCPRRPT
jgi:hypothetical protein